MTSDAKVVVMDVATVCSVYDDPAIRIGVDPEDLLTDIRVKSVDTGRILACGSILRPLVCDGKVYIMLPADFEIGSMVAFGLRTIGHMEMREWFGDDHEVPLGDFLRGSVACLTTPGSDDEQEGTEEAPAEPVTADTDTPEASQPPEDDGSQDALCARCDAMTPAELRTVILQVMRTQDRAMTVREIVLCLNMEYVDSNRSRVNDTLVSMEDKGLVKRGGSVRSGGRPSTTWVIA